MASASFINRRREVNYYTGKSSLPTRSYGSHGSPSSDSDLAMDEVPMLGDNEEFEMDETEYLTRSGARNSRHGGLFTWLSDCFTGFCTSCCDGCIERCRRGKPLQPRTLWIGRSLSKDQSYPSNRIRNQKYNIVTFIPKVLYQQFKFFLNLYFLVMAISQFVPSIRIGYLYTYWIPLIFVLSVTMIREAVDDCRRFRRDREVNNKKYKKLTKRGLVDVISANIQVGDLILVNKDERVPADMVFIRTTEKGGACFIRTDQLDGETDWKLRLAIRSTQALPTDHDLFDIKAQVYAERPQKDIHSFVGTFTRTDDNNLEEDSLNVENTLWCNTVVASGKALGLVVYTGRETRSVMNTSQPTSKFGLLDNEVNNLTKILFVGVVALSILMMVLKGFDGPWYRYLFRFILLFSYIIPISLRVNLDMGKAFYSWMIQKDDNIPGTVVRCTTIPEELGRIQYLMSDKTGTLTQNDMIFKKLHLGSVSYGEETMDEVKAHLGTAYSQQASQGASTSAIKVKIRRTVVSRVFEAVKAIALCHNVTPMYDDDAAQQHAIHGESDGRGGGMNELTEDDISYEIEADQSQRRQKVTYQASSPDEVALVSWTDSLGLALVSRDLTSMVLRTPANQFNTYTILQIFPFTSETKRMGIIVREEETGEIMFYMKGADVVMQAIVQFNDWLEEECGNMAREGLRTLVVAKKSLSEDQYQDFENRYHQAKMSIQDRNAKLAAVVESLERDMELLCLTGVEDRLQDNVKPTLELLRNAGIKVWMLTGDKMETATCIAKSSMLVSRRQTLHTFKPVYDRTEAHLELNAFRRKNDCCLVITGESLEVCLKYYEHEFVELACQCPAVVVCRCSPTQKAEIVKLIKNHTGKRTCAIGDGGNDVSMIQAADAGVGIEGKEGKQASLAADFSLTQFCHLGRLLLVHGRYSYKRSAALAQFVIHRGLIISTMQAIFSAVFYFASISIFPSLLMVGYATVFTSAPVFSLVLDMDVKPDIAMTYPELYKELTKGRTLSYKTFFIWVLISIYAGGILMFGSLFLFESEFLHVVAITFTALILVELLMIGLSVRSWHWLMIVAELFSLGVYIASVAVLSNIFDPEFLRTTDFIWKVIVITAVSCIPLYVLKYLRKKFSPPSYSKL